ncbi:unnamed protein product, partial [Rotaria sordida]
DQSSSSSTAPPPPPTTNQSPSLIAPPPPHIVENIQEPSIIPVVDKSNDKKLNENDLQKTKNKNKKKHWFFEIRKL